MTSGLLISPERFTGQLASFDFRYLAFETAELRAPKVYQGETGERELALVVLGGQCSVRSSRGSWLNIGRRRGVFEGRPHTLYLPVRTEFTIHAENTCELAMCYAKAEEEHEPRLVRPEEVEVEIRGGGNATRQIHHILRPEFPAHRILVVEVYTPAGNWSSYPPHKHDVHNPPNEVCLEEIYYYRMRRQEGYAIQKVYTKDRELDDTLTVRHGEVVLVPRGYHPVVAAHGYDVYYLNALAGSARSMAASDDPDFAWVRAAWRERDPRLPLF